MKSIGIVRKVDDLGRVVVPMDIRQSMGFDVNQTVEIFVRDDEVVLRKYDPGCAFCGESEDIMELRGTRVCRACVSAICRE